MHTLDGGLDKLSAPAQHLLPPALTAAPFCVSRPAGRGFGAHSTDREKAVSWVRLNLQKKQGLASGTNCAASPVATWNLVS